MLSFELRAVLGVMFHLFERDPGDLEQSIANIVFRKPEKGMEWLLEVYLNCGIAWGVLCSWEVESKKWSSQEKWKGGEIVKRKKKYIGSIAGVPLTIRRPWCLKFGPNPNHAGTEWIGPMTIEMKPLAPYKSIDLHFSRWFVLNPMIGAFKPCLEINPLPLLKCFATTNEAFSIQSSISSIVSSWTRLARN